mmetsp:Transcript_876/g.2729  ORF Transcript_876/g.2729 Transcript_876/m.2729 type:complete len:240 (+) Transcript_876:394-1113(+)
MRDVDGLFHGLHLGNGDGLHEGHVGELAGAELVAEPCLALAHKAIEAVEAAGVLSEEGAQLRDVAEHGLPRGCPAGLLVRIGLGALEEAPSELERGLRDRHAAREEPLANHVEDGHALDLLHHLAVHHVGEAVEKGAAREHHRVEADGRVVEVVAHGLAAHILEEHARGRRPAGLVAHAKQERVRAVGLAVDLEVGDDHGAVGHEALGDPVLPRATSWGVEGEGVRVGVVGGRGVDHEA